MTATKRPDGGELSFQKRVLNWLMECFSNEVCRDGVERNHRFLEESLELVQSLGCTRSEAHQLVDYVFGRPVGEPFQELGGVMVTMSALASCHDMDFEEAAETELARVWTKIEKIRAKQLAKPKHSPLPEATPTNESPAPQAEALIDHIMSLEGDELDAALRKIGFDPKQLLADFDRGMSAKVEEPVSPIGWSAAMEIVERGFVTWKDKPHNAKWFRKIDGTPIPNDLCVNIAQSIADASLYPATKLSAVTRGEPQSAPQPPVEGLREALEYALGALRTIAGAAKNSSPSQLAAVAQAGIDLATIGPEGCAEMRGDTDAALASPSLTAVPSMRDMLRSVCKAGGDLGCSCADQNYQWFDGNCRELMVQTVRKHLAAPATLIEQSGQKRRER